MTRQQIQDLDDLDLLNRSLQDFLASLEKSKKKTRDYLQEIAGIEGLFGDVGDEKNREILIKYFNNYQFEDEMDAKVLLYAFLGKDPILAVKYAKIENLLRDVNRKFLITATIDKDLVMKVDKEYNFVPVLKDYFDLVEKGTLKEMEEFENKYLKNDDGEFLPGVLKNVE